MTFCKGYFWNVNTLQGILIAAHSGTLSFKFAGEEKANYSPLEPIQFKSELILNFDIIPIKEHKLTILAIGLSNGNVDLFYSNSVSFLVMKF